MDADTSTSNNISIDLDSSSYEQISRTSISQSFSSAFLDARSRVFSYGKKPNIGTQFVVKAVKILTAEEDGASVIAITKWAMANYAISDVGKFKNTIKQAVLRALNEGYIQRAPKSKKALSFCGSFVLAKKALKSLEKGGSKKSMIAKKPRSKKMKGKASASQAVEKQLGEGSLE